MSIGRLKLTFDGLREMLQDLRKQGMTPAAVLVNELDKRDLKQELLASSIEHQKYAEEENHDLETIGFIEGAVIISHPHMTRGSVRVLDAKDLLNRNADVRAA